MKIAVIGATGNLGGAVAHEAAGRGHLVTALNRASVDATDPHSLTAALVGHDAVIAAVKGPGEVVPRVARALLIALPLAGIRRLIFLGGGGSLEYAPGRRYVDSPDFPAQYLQTARDQAEALRILRDADTDVAWTYASPPPVHLVPGPRTDRYRAEARDTPLTDEHGDSRISIGDYAASILDALENASFVRQRFTAAY